MFQGMFVLFVEDDAAVRDSALQSLELADFEVIGLSSAEAALPYITPDFPGVVVSDVRLVDMDGLALLDHAQQVAPQLSVILITGHGDISMAVEAMRRGAYDFIEKPFAPDHLIEVLTRALDRRKLALENSGLRRQLRSQSGHSGLIGSSAAMTRVRARIADVAGTDAPVLVVGDTGTGKEMVARSLHEQSPRRARPFVALNCAALPEHIFESEMFGFEAGAFTGAAKRRIGKIEHAHGGTLFLDEIESMPLTLQAKLLRVLQDGTLERLGSNQAIKADFRLVTAVKGDLLALANQGKFRNDLFYRINVVAIELPALRERREDIRLLFEHFVLEAAVRYQRPAPLLPAALGARLCAQDWPGNVRELRNVADRFVLGIPLYATAGAHAAATLPEQMDAFEAALIQDALRTQQGRVAQAAEVLGIPKTTLYDKLRKHAIEPGDTLREGRGVLP